VPPTALKLSECRLAKCFSEQHAMSEIKLSSDEAQALRAALSTLVIRDRTGAGEIGIVHGMDRFVSTHRTFDKAERAALEATARKLGLAGMRLHKS